MGEVKKTWVVVLKEEPTGPLEFDLGGENDIVDHYWQFIDGEGFHFEIWFKDGKWVDFPCNGNTPSLNSLILQGYKHIVELVGIAPIIPAMSFGDAAKPRFSEKDMKQVESLVISETDRVKAAAALAKLAHTGQVDKAGRDYIDHPRRVFEQVSSIPGFSKLSKQKQIDTKISAWLHDVMEDSGKNAFGQVLPSDLAEWGFTADQIWICEDLNKYLTLTEEKRDFESYIEQINQRAESRLVKIADSADNNNISRIKAVDTKTKEPFDQTSNQATRAALNLSKDENEWFENSIRTVVI
jgi:hypothetical protein